MSSLNSSGADNSNANPGRKPDEISPGQQEAFSRVFFYLQTLRVPEEKSLELAREALQLAGSNQINTSIPEAMRALRVLLKKQVPLLGNDPFCQNNLFLTENLDRVSSMPPLNRGYMVPNAIDLIPWRTSIVRSIKRAVSLISRPLNFLILFIVLIIMLLLLTFWK